MKEEPANDFKAWEAADGTVISSRWLKTLSVDKVRTFCKSWNEFMPKQVDELTITLLEELEGHKICHHHMKTPFVMSNRSYVATYFLEETSEDEFWFAFSTTNNEELHVKYADRIGKDQIAIGTVVLHCKKDAENGCRVMMNLNADPQGSVPQMMKNKLKAR